MTVKKALRIIDAIIGEKQNKKTGFLDPKMSWNQGEPNISEFAKGLAQVMDNDIRWLLAVKNQLHSKKQAKCMHPKRLHDIDPDGNPYCMGCGQDL